MSLRVVMGTSVLVVIFGALIYWGPDIHRHFGQRYADADREIHQKSLSYVRGTIENLQRLKLEYQMADNDGHKSILRETALVSVSTVDETKLPPHLRSWLAQLRSL